MQASDLSPRQQLLVGMANKVPQGVIVLYESITEEVHFQPLNLTLEEMIWVLGRAIAIAQESLPKPQMTTPQTPEEIEAEINRRTQAALAQLGADRPDRPLPGSP